MRPPAARPSGARTPWRASRLPFPAKDEVLRFVRESPGKVGRREIARALRYPRQRPRRADGAPSRAGGGRRARRSAQAAPSRRHAALSDGAGGRRTGFRWGAHGPARVVGGARSAAARHAGSRAHAACASREKATACWHGSDPRRTAATWRAPCACSTTAPPGSRHLPRRRTGRRHHRARRPALPPRFRGTGGSDRRRPLRRAGGGRDLRGPAPRAGGSQSGRAPGRRGLAGRHQPRRDSRPRAAGTLPRRCAGGSRASVRTGPRRADGPCARSPW